MTTRIPALVFIIIVHHFAHHYLKVTQVKAYPIELPSRFRPVRGLHKGQPEQQQRIQRQRQTIMKSSISGGDSNSNIGWIVRSLGKNDDDDVVVGLPNHDGSTMKKRKMGTTTVTTTEAKGEDFAPSTSSATNSKKTIPTRLILHFDINETILLGDKAGGDTRQDCIQKMLAKSAFVRIPSDSKKKEMKDYQDDENQETSPTTSWHMTRQMEPTHWWDGQEMGKETTIPPLYTGWDWPANCCPYYRTKYKTHCQNFVNERHGKVYKPVLEACEKALSASSSDGSKGHPSSSSESKKNKEEDEILQAFYVTLEYMIQSKEPFTIVFRTFGGDLADLASSITDFATGKHPSYPHINFPDLVLPTTRLFQGRWKEHDNNTDDYDDDKKKQHVTYQLWDQDENEIVASGDKEILQLLNQYTILGICDDYPYWMKNGHYPTAGKPVWVPRFIQTPSSDDDDDDDDDEQQRRRRYPHHILFDDNIHNLPDDGIACVRRQKVNSSSSSEHGDGDDDDDEYETMDSTTMHREMHGMHLIRVPTVEPILNPKWFIEQIAMAKEKLQQRLLRGG